LQDKSITSEVKSILAQTVLPFRYEVETRDGGMTALAGLPLYLELAHAMGLPRLIEAHGGDRGWTDEQMIMALVLLNLAGGDCVDDLRVLEGNEGFCRVFRDLEFYGRTRSEKRALKRRWRKSRTRTFPSPTAMREYLELFHDPEQENLRAPHEAFIPAPSELLGALSRLNGSFAAAVQRRTPQTTALDMDATLVETFKKAALYCYKKFKAYQPLNVYWAEQRLMLFSEFRDGNVPAGYDLLRPFKQALELVPA
jgi:hypothetical protein